MKTIVQVEFRQSTLELREDILTGLGHPVKSLVGEGSARSFEPSEDVGVIVIGHGAPWAKRQALIAYFWSKLSAVPIITLLRRSDAPFPGATFNCPADPVKWLATVRKALEVWN
jgi:hypothetical protein